MGKILKIKKWTTTLEALVLVVAVSGILFAVYEFAPRIQADESKALEGLVIDDSRLDNISPEAELPLPSTIPSIKVAKENKTRMAAYAWNGETSIIIANGGPRTTKGSLMEANNVNLEFTRQDWLSGLREMQMKFITDYDAGQKNPSSDKAAFAIIIMGDGAPYYISSTQASLDAKFGKDKYHVQVIGCMGMSDGEDKLIGPPEWKTDPQSMIGALISTVPGDGDWVTTLNYCFANNLPVNPSFDVYDPNAVNFYPSADDDYINSANELIASVTEGFVANYSKVIENGQLVNKKFDKKIDGCATWTPGDKMVFDRLSGFTDIASTRDFPNQMATTIIAFKEWSEENRPLVQNILKSALTASNQIKQYDSWRRAGGNAVAATFDLEDGNYWYSMYQGQEGSKNGLKYSMGGTRALNYSDVMQYYGQGKDGINRYKAVYDQVSTYLVELNPFDFNTVVGEVVPYEKAVNLSFLTGIEGMVQTTDYETTDYSEDRTNVMAKGEWNINFNTASADILPSSDADIDRIYNLLLQAEQTKISIIGHTDSQGDPNFNLSLSDKRANSVAEELLARGISVDRFQIVEGHGENDPLADNNNSVGRAKNRRVTITFLQ